MHYSSFDSYDPEQDAFDRYFEEITRIQEEERIRDMYEDEDFVEDYYEEDDYDRL